MPSIRRTAFLLILLSVLGVGFAHAQTTNFCSQYAPLALSNGYNFQNDFYNSSGGSLCSDVNTTNGSFTVQNTNSVATNGAPGGYPSIYLGCHYGNCTSDGGGMPIQQSLIGSATSSWDVTPANAGAWDIAYDIWFNQTPSTTGQPDGVEIMVWLNHKGGVQPAGQSTGQTVTVNGIAFTPWVGDKIVSYVANTPVNSVSNLNLQAFFQDTMQRGLLQSSWYLIDVEAGTEVWQDGSGFKSNSFSVNVSHK